MSVSREKLS